MAGDRVGENVIAQGAKTSRYFMVLFSWCRRAVDWKTLLIFLIFVFGAIWSYQVLLKKKPVDFSDPALRTVRIKDHDGREVIVPRTNRFHDDFEAGIERRIEGWHQHMKLASDSNPGKPDNSVEITTEKIRSGRFALKTHTSKDPRDLQKAALLRELFFFPPGSNCWFSAWFYIPGAESIENLFIFDLEATGYHGVGRRLMFTGKDGRYLMLEGKRSTGPQFSQTVSPVPFPRNQWVHVKLHLFLSPGEDGRVQLWQDGKLILDKNGRNMVENTFYDRVEVGQTANSTHRDLTMFVDDVRISDEPLED